MEKLGPKLCIAALTLLPWMVSDAWAQEWLHLRPLQGRVSLGFDGFWQDSETVGRSSDIEFEERIRLRQSGDIVNPGLASFSLEVEPTFTQGRFDSADRDDTRDGSFLNYNGNLSLLQGPISPVGLTAGAGRSTGETDGGLGSRTEFDSEYRNVALNWKYRMFPGSLSYSEQYRDQTFRSGLGGASSKTDNVLRSVRLTGQSSKTGLLLERDWYDDRVEVTDSDYTSNHARLTHRLDWGKGSRLQSRIDYLDRGGFNASKHFTVDESARIQHTENLASTAAYGLFWSSVQGVDTTTNSGNWALNHQLYRNLNTTLDVTARVRDSDLSTQEDYSGGMNLAYRKRIPWGGTFSAGLGGDYRITDRDSEGGLNSVGLPGERHVVDATLRFFLNQRFVVQSTIVVYATTCAPSGCLLNQDYRVLSVGGEFTEIEILLGGPGNLNVGDTVDVTYDYEVLPSQKFSTTSLEYNAGLNFGWISIYHRGSASNQKRISGAADGGLTDRRQSTTGMNLKWNRPDFSARLGAEWRYLDNGSFDTMSLNITQTLSYSASRRMSLNFSANEVFSETDGRDSDVYSADLSASWRPWGALSLTPHVGAWLQRNEETGIGGTQEERFITAGLDLHWSWRAIELDLRYSHNHREGAAATTDDDRVALNVSRRF